MAPATKNNKTVNGPRLMAWGDGGISGPQMATLQFPDAGQMYIWKLAAALKTVHLYNGSFSRTASSASVYNFTMCKSWNVTACVPLPYLLLIGNFVFFFLKIFLVSTVPYTLA